MCIGTDAKLLLALVRDDLVGLLTFICDLDVFDLGTRCSLAGSALHGPEQEGRRLSPTMAWWVRCIEVRWLYL